MNEIQKKIDAELRRPNAGKNALCNQVADVASVIAESAGGSTNIPLLRIDRVEEVTNSNGTTYKQVIFDDDSNKVLDDMINYEELPGYTTITSTLPCKISRDDLEKLYFSSINAAGESFPDYILLDGEWYGVELTLTTLEENDNSKTQYLMFSLPLPIYDPIVILRYIYGSQEELLNKWVFAYYN